MMDIWEARYKALCIGMENSKAIENAEKLIEATVKVSSTTCVPFDQVLATMVYVTGKLYNADYERRREVKRRLNEKRRQRQWRT
jgi:hypothetical protein